VRITLISPDNNHLDGDGNITFYYVPESLNDFNTTGTCELYLDGSSNKTAVRPTNGYTNNITIDNIGQGSHTWYLNCSDNAGIYGVSETRSFLVDLIDPSVDLNYPLAETIGLSYVNFNFTATDNIASYLMCNITVNETISAYNINATNGSATNRTVYGFNDGSYYWNVTCVDYGRRVNTR